MEANLKANAITLGGSRSDLAVARGRVIRGRAVLPDMLAESHDAIPRKTRRLGLLGCLTAALLVGGCATRPPPAPPAPPPTLFEDVSTRTAKHAAELHYLDHGHDKETLLAWMTERHAGILAAEPEVSETEATERAINAVLGEIDSVSRVRVWSNVSVAEKALEAFGMSAEGVVITQVVEDGAADRAGLRTGDRILRVDGFGAERPGGYLVFRYLAGAPGTEVPIRVEREGEGSVLVTAIRPGDPSPNAITRFEPDDIAHVIYRRSSHKFLDKMLYQLKQKARIASRPAALILDLRGNAGDSVGNVAHLATFLSVENDALWMTVPRRPRDPDRVVGDRVPAGRKGGVLLGLDKLWPDIPVLILTDEDTRSGIRFLAELLQATGRAELVGTLNEKPRNAAVRTSHPLFNFNEADGWIQIWTGNLLPPPGVEMPNPSRVDIPARDNPDTPEDETLDAALKRLNTLLGV